MTISVLIPYAGTCPHRARALAYVARRYDRLGWEVCVAGDDTDPWCKARAVDAALERATGTTLVVADADCWSNDTEALVANHEPGTWAMPHVFVWRLDQASTAAVIDDGLEPTKKMRRTRSPYRGVPGGGIAILDRATYERCPLDRRFVDWGGEDMSWGWALHATAGRPRHLAGPLWHLWHPPARPARPPFSPPESQALAGQYSDARRDPTLMARLLEEARQCRSPIST